MAKINKTLHSFFFFLSSVNTSTFNKTLKSSVKRTVTVAVNWLYKSFRLFVCSTDRDTSVYAIYMNSDSLRWRRWKQVLQVCTLNTNGLSDSTFYFTVLCDESLGVTGNRGQMLYQSSIKSNSFSCASHGSIPQRSGVKSSEKNSPLCRQLSWCLFRCQ